MPKVLFYTKTHCPLCDDALVLLTMLQREHGFELEEIDIYQDDALLEQYQLRIPVAKIGNTILDCEHMDMESLSHALVNS